MITVKGKYNSAKVFTDTLEEEAMRQVIELLDQEAFKNAKVRIMPDAHPGMGCVIGHEITHGFDDQGRQYNADGNIKDWWTKEDSDKFDKRAKKIIDQFNAFEPLDSLFINGELKNHQSLNGIRERLNND